MRLHVLLGRLAVIIPAGIGFSRRKMARWWVRLGGETGPHVASPRIYSLAANCQLNFHLYTISDNEQKVNHKIIKLEKNA
jgi:hypothetical protein